LRHVRNQIAHSAESSSCTKEDLDRLKNFYARLLHGEDALSVYSRLRTAKQPKQQERTRRKRRSRKRIPVIILAIFLVSLFILAYIAFHLLSHI
jgi:type VI protein secretion system component VasF